MTCHMHRRQHLAALGLMLVAPAWPVLAQDTRTPIRLLVGYPPGGPADTAARIIAEPLGRELNRTVLVENRPGAGGQIAAQALKQAPGDGSTLFLSNTHTVAMVPLTQRAPGFDTGKDFRLLGAVATFDLALAVHPKATATDLQRLGRWLVANPGEAAIGVPAPASAPEFIARRLARVFSVDAVPVPYKGAAPLVQDLLGGQVMLGVSGVSDFLQYHQAGRLKILALTGRNAALPDVPTFSAAGVNGIDLSDFQGLYAPAAMSDAQVATINAALNAVLGEREVQQKLEAQAMGAIPGTPAAQARRLSTVAAGFDTLVRESGYQPQ